jgi:hypothetical protein
MNELELELRARQLVGETIEEVHYQQLPWTARAAIGDGSHGVELAVHLRMASGRRFRIGWADELGLHHGHHITVTELRVVDRDAGPLERIDWPRRTIRAATIEWRDVREALRGSLRTMVGIGGDYLRRLDYPQTLQLDLDGTAPAQIFVSAARLGADGVASGFTNHLLVVFSYDELRRLQL